MSAGPSSVGAASASTKPPAGNRCLAGLCPRAADGHLGNVRINPAHYKIDEMRVGTVADGSLRVLAAGHAEPVVPLGEVKAAVAQQQGRQTRG